MHVQSEISSPIGPCVRASWDWHQLTCRFNGSYRIAANKVNVTDTQGRALDHSPTVHRSLRQQSCMTRCSHLACVKGRWISSADDESLWPSGHLYPPNAVHARTPTESIFSKVSHLYEINKHGGSYKFCPVYAQPSADVFLFMDFHVFPRLLSQL